MQQELTPVIIYDNLRQSGPYTGGGGGSMGSVEPPPWRFRWFVDSNCMLILSSILLFTCMIYGIGEMPKRHDNFFLFCWYEASLGGYQCTVKMWIAHSKGHL